MSSSICSSLGNTIQVCATLKYLALLRFVHLLVQQVWVTIQSIQRMLCCPVARSFKAPQAVILQAQQERAALLLCRKHHTTTTYSSAPKCFEQAPWEGVGDLPGTPASKILLCPEGGCPHTMRMCCQTLVLCAQPGSLWQCKPTQLDLRHLSGHSGWIPQFHRAQGCIDVFTGVNEQNSPPRSSKSY